MNFFFGLKQNNFKSLLTIPKFQNTGHKKKNYELFSAIPINKKWVINKVECFENKNFYKVESNCIDNSLIFFLSTEEELSNKDFCSKKLEKLNNFTDTKPIEFRSNLKIIYNELGFSSYQAEYPLSMMNNKGNVLSPISMLLSKCANKNYIFFKNIIADPFTNEFKIYLLDLKLKKILLKKNFLTNYSNFLEIDKEFIRPNVYFYSKNYLGIPIYISVKENQLSLEHTHPPHHYILGNDKFEMVKKMKNNINEIFDI